MESAQTRSKLLNCELMTVLQVAYRFEVTCPSPRGSKPEQGAGYIICSKGHLLKLSSLFK